MLDERDDMNDFFEELINYNFIESPVQKESEQIINNTLDNSPIQQEYCFNLNNERIKSMMSNFYPYTIDPNQYTFEIVEQPEQCRLSSSFEKDRRPIDPAPIVKLKLKTSNNIENTVECPFYVAHASLWSMDTQQQYDLYCNTKLLIGNIVSTPSLLRDLNGEQCYYFAFPDLSMTMTGQYRLKISLIHLVSNKIIKEVFTDIFTVYSAKSFPGIKKSSQICKHLAKQGLKLTIRSQLKAKKSI